tara:strand:+ start:612 stop:965 length:354 start_codon:yes stop_codon:yes gene_type:complete
MKLPTETAPVLWGAAGGALALAIVGFTWGGWMTSGNAEVARSDAVDVAVVAALTPVCVANFRRDPDVVANLVALKEVDSWNQRSLIEKGGWISVAGSEPLEQSSSVAKACGEILVKE